VSAPASTGENFSIDVVTEGDLRALLPLLRAWPVYDRVGGVREQWLDYGLDIDW
jgi:hypothetical protein